MCELCYLIQSNHASLLLLEIFSTRTFIVSLVTGCHVVITFDEGEHIPNLVLGVLCFTRQKNLRFCL